MKYKSWEIIVAGLLLVGFSAYLIQKKENTKKYMASSASEATGDSLKTEALRKEIRIITHEQLSSLEELKKLNKLENLKDLEKLGHLEKLKSLAGFLPAEAQSDFIREIDSAIHELDTQLSALSVDIKAQSGTPTTAPISKSWYKISPGVYAYAEEFDASHLKSTTLALPFGSVTVNGSTNKKAHITIRASGKIQSPEDLQAKLVPVFNLSGTNAEMKFQTPRSIDNIHLQATLNIPANMELAVTTNGGHIEVSGISGEQTYHTKGGHIRLNNLTGNIDAKTSGGHISLDKGSGSIKLVTAGGHISVSESDATIQAQTSGGNIKGEHVSGLWTASTTAGNIDVALDAVRGDSHFKTGAGAITLWLPATVNARLSSRGSSFEIDPKFNFSGQQGSSGTKGKIGEGGSLIEISTNYGKVSVKAQ